MYHYELELKQDPSSTIMDSSSSGFGNLILTENTEPEHVNVNATEYEQLFGEDRQICISSFMAFRDLISFNNKSPLIGTNRPISLERVPK